MTNDDLNRALDRLRDPDRMGAWLLGDEPIHDTHLSAPLAALIEAAAVPSKSAGGEWCHCCGTPVDRRPPWPHTPDCALVGLVRAINGEKPTSCPDCEGRGCVECAGVTP